VGAGRNLAALGLLFTWTRGTLLIIFLYKTVELTVRHTQASVLPERILIA
jgi:hypothetical protein